ncbi:arylsulfatase [Tichowtungia aerotolerans]|uniref:Arylsulfatase n=1 Tax=Tichowtungia aerotolerans TaxID=2697043 RepID=A0A6P1MA14_9BACT|nr:arylsulfatase [Tichowtungia aerotolerans]QHI69394.1 arylsulfatase [Tichowtungia aerotolerans]
MSRRPNIIFILCDQMRGDCLGSDGNPVIQTPNLDRLAGQGTRFLHAYSAVPSCIPSRAILWSGQSQWHTGVLGMNRDDVIPCDFPHTLAGELTAAGYQTQLVGKGHFEPQRASMGFEQTVLDESGRMPDSDFRQWFSLHAPAGVTPDDHGVGWNSWHACAWHTDEALHPTSWTVSRSIEFLKEHDRGRPFFLNISFARPHSPYDPPARWFSCYERQELPDAFVGDWAQMHDDPETAKKEDAWRGTMSPEQVHRARSGYYGSISFMDEQIGRLLEWMEREIPDELENTWFLFLSDHGDMLGDHNLWRKTYAYEGSARVPFLIAPPKKMQGDVRLVADEVVELRDVMPTVLGMAGVPVPSAVDGRSLIPLLNAPAEDWRTYIHGEHRACYSPEQEMHYVTDGRRKFIWLPRIQREQFFDLEADPGEYEDLIEGANRQGEIQRWRGYLIRELESRRCGWVKNGKLVAPDSEPLVSPFEKHRWTGSD